MKSTRFDYKSLLKFVLVITALAVLCSWEETSGRERDNQRAALAQEQAEKQAASVRGTSEEPGISPQDKMHRLLAESYAQELTAWWQEEEAIRIAEATHELMTEHPTLKHKGFMEICVLATNTTEGCRYTAAHLNTLSMHYLHGEPKPDSSLSDEESKSIYEDWLPGSGGMFPRDN